MFDIGWSEMMVVGAVALVVIGPKDLPGALRQAGKWMGAVRRMANDFQGQVNAAMREAEFDELRREVQNLKSGVTDPVQKHESEMRALVEAPAALPPPSDVKSDTKAEPAPDTVAKPVKKATAKPAAKPRAGAKPAAKPSARPAAAKPAAKAKAAPKKPAPARTKS